MASLFSPLPFRGITLPNRIAVSPMCQYSSVNGFANDWHLVNLGARAVGGAGLVFTEATAITAAGRISPQDLGIWHDDHIEQLARITAFVKQQGAYPGIQLAHAGRKASTRRPWEGHGEVPAAEGGWPVLGPSALPFADNYPAVTAMTGDDIATLTADFVAAARRALRAGFSVIELHAAHGYLLHEFLSPLSNRRTDAYGGSLDNRLRLVLEIAAAIRDVVPDAMPLMVRVSATDWTDGGWSIDDSVILCRALRQTGVDLIDVSTGGNVARAEIPVGPGYQVPFARQIRQEAAIATGAVGMITTAEQADAIVRGGQADIVLLARELLRDPHWPLHAAQRLGVPQSWPAQYLRAGPPGSPSRSPVS